MPSIFPDLNDLEELGLKKYLIHRLKVWTIIFILGIVLSTIYVVIIK